MQRFEEKAEDLADYFEMLVHRFVLDPRSEDDFSYGALKKQEFRVVDALGKGSCMMSEIAARVRLAVSSVTGIVDKLVGKGLVFRERSNEDRRIVCVELTDKGKEIYQRVREDRMRLIRGILSSLNESEQDALLALFRKMTRSVQVQSKRA